MLSSFKLEEHKKSEEKGILLLFIHSVKIDWDSQVHP